MSDIENYEEDSSSAKQPIMKKEFESLNANIGKVVHNILASRQIEYAEAVDLNIHKRILDGKFDKVKLPQLLQCLLSLDHEIELTINPINKKHIRLYYLEPQIVKLKKIKGKK
jgi:hypothetical protein